ncbi:serine/threonine-protein kinase gin4 [Rhizoctonia solani]
MSDDSDQSSTRETDQRALKLINVGPWRLGKVIGRGSSGLVRVATHKINGQMAAVKIMSTEAIFNSRMSVDGDPEQAERIIQSIEREIVIMKLLEHPNILGLLDVWEAKGLLFVIMEYIDGGELFDYIVEKGRIPIPEAIHYFQQVMYAVAYCHRFRIAHRDLKPENILMDKNNNIKVADFGMAAFVPRDSFLYTSCGSPHYASPEVVSGLAYNGAISDVWSCGVILYALLSGKLPFDDEDIRALLGKVREGNYSIPADIPWPAQNLIRRMMEKDVDRRIEVVEVLQHPFFRSITPRILPTIAPTFDHLAGSVPKGIGKLSIDNDIMKNMRTLWRNRQDSDIIRAIYNPHDNWEKIAYHLLYEFRTKRLKCIGSDGNEYEPRKRPGRQCQELPFRTPALYSSFDISENASTESPCAPTPGYAHSFSVSDGPTTSNPTSPIAPTAPLTPRKRTRTEPIGNSSAETLPEIVIHQASPTKKGAKKSVDSLLCNEITCCERLSPYPQPKPTGPFVPIDGPEMEGDMFFHQITEMLVNMSNQELESSRKAPVAPEKNGGKGKAELIGEKLGAMLELKLPANQVAPPPTTPVTPNFLNHESSIEASESIGPTIRAVPQSKVLKPSNVGNLPRESKTQIVSVTAKENTPFVLSEPPRGRMRSKTANAAQPQSRSSGPVKKHVRIVTPDRNSFVRPRKRTSSANREHEMATSINTPFVFPRSSENWFSNLFHLKPTRYDLYSVHDVFSTRSQCMASLQLLGVHVEAGEPQPQTYGGITLRCHLDSILDPSGTTVVSKPLRFRVEIWPSNGVKYAAGYLSEITFALDKGSQANFAAFFERVRAGWEMHVSYRMEGSLEVLDVQTGQPLPSPALTVGGRYAEV